MAQSRDSFTFIPSAAFSLEEKPVSEVEGQTLLPLPVFDLDLANLNAGLTTRHASLLTQRDRVESFKTLYESKIDEYNEALSAQFPLEQQYNRNSLIREAIRAAIVDLLQKGKIRKAEVEQFLDFQAEYRLGGNLLDPEVYNVYWNKSPNELYQAQSAAQLVLTLLDSGSDEKQFLSDIKTYIQKQLRDPKFNKASVKFEQIIQWPDSAVFPAITTESQDKTFQEQLKAAREKIEEPRYYLFRNGSVFDNKIKNYNNVVEKLTTDLENLKNDIAAARREAVVPGSVAAKSMPPSGSEPVPAVAAAPVVQTSEKKEEESGPQKFRRITTDLAEIAYAVKGEESRFSDKELSELGDTADKLLKEGIEVVNKIANPDERAHAAKVITERYLTILPDLAVKSLLKKNDSLYLLVSDPQINLFLEGINNKVQSLEKGFPDRANQHSSRSPRLYQPAQSASSSSLIKEFKLGVEQLGARLKDINDLSSALTRLRNESNRYVYIKELAAQRLKEAAAPQSGKDRSPRK